MGPGLTMGQSSTMAGNPNQQVIPGVRIDITNLRGTTRFNDLQEDLQNQIMLIDSGIDRAISQCNELEAFMPAHGEQVELIPNDVRFVARKYEGVNHALGDGAHGIKKLKDTIQEDAGAARLSFRAVDNLKLPTAYHVQGLWRSTTSAAANAATTGSPASAPSGSSGGDGDAAQQDLVSFFSAAAEDMERQLRQYRDKLREMENHMNGVNVALHEQLHSCSGREDQLAELAAVLREFEEGILRVAGKVGGVREGLTRLQLGEVLGQGAN